MRERLRALVPAFAASLAAGAGAWLAGRGVTARAAAWLDVLEAYTWDNPVFLKEQRLHFRSPRTYIMHFGYLLVLTAILAGLVAWSVAAVSSGGRTRLWEVGQWTYRGIVALHALFLAILLSSLGAGGVVSEKEAKTYEVIEALPLPMGMFVAGKFVSLMVLSGLLMVSSLPLLMLALSTVGGVTAEDIIRAFIGLGGLAAACTSVGLLASCVAPTPRNALFLTHRILGLFLMLAWFGGGSLAVATRGGLHATANSLTLLVGLVAAPFIFSSFWAILPPVAVCSGVASLCLTAAADRLRHPNEKRPYLLLSQLFVLFCLLAAVYVAGYILSIRGHVATVSMPSPTAFGSLGFMELQTVALAVLAVLVLPSRDMPQPGWRSCFTTGPTAGAGYLLLCLAATDLVAILLLPFAGMLGGSAVPGPPMLFITGQFVILGSIVLWAGMARLARHMFPAHSHAAYSTAFVLITVLPFLLQSLLLRASPVLIVTLMLSLNPWLALWQIDPASSTGVFSLLGMDPTPLSMFSLLMSTALGLTLFYLAGTMAEARDLSEARARSRDAPPGQERTRPG